MFIIYAKAGKGLGVQGCGGIQKIRQFSMKFDTMGLRNTGFVFSAVVKGTAGVCRGYNMIRMYDAGFRNSGKRGRLSSSLLRAAVAAALGLGLVLGGSAMAADNTAGSGNGVAIGTGSNAPKTENVAIGKGATIKYSNGESKATGDVAIGNGTVIDNYASQGGSIAIGNNAKIENMAGGGEASFAFGQTTYSGNSWSRVRIPADPTRVIGSVAIGDNTFARTGSTMIGSHNYKGELGDTTVDSSSTRTYALNVYSTTLGANSFSNGAFTTSTGVYNIISSAYNGGRTANPVQNLGATINGSLNSVESMKGGKYSGIANTITGLANRTSNSNGALIYGAGNEITNSIVSLSSIPDDSGSSAKDFAGKLRTAISSADGGGAALAIGGGNKIDKSILTQVLGVNNEVTGSLYHEDEGFFGLTPEVNEYSSQYNMVDGYNNKVTNANNAYVIGSNNTILGKTFSADTKDGTLSKGDRAKAKESDNLVIIGDNHTMDKDVKNNIVIGSSDNTLTTSVSNAVLLGHNADVKKDGGVALGSGSIATIDANVFGWDPSTKVASTTDTIAWKSSWAAVSVGDSTHTRQITNVAAGFNDTDAVNVAQLKAAIQNAGTSISLVAGDGIKIDTNNGTYTISANITGGKTDTDKTTVTPKDSGSGSAGSSSGSTDSTDAGKELVVTTDTEPTKFAADEGTAAEVKPSQTLSINGDQKNISTKVDGISISVKLKDDISVKTVTASDSIGITNGPSMSTNGIDAAGKKITNVAAGTADTDAVNYGQLKGVESKVDNNTQAITNINGRVGELGSRINKVGAGAAALAALHPLDFDPHDKWDVAVGVGNYRNETAAAVGLFYRPSARTMFNLGWTMGDNRNMVNGGFSVKLGSGSVYNDMSKAQMAETISGQATKIDTLKNTVDQQDRKISEQDRKIAELEEMVKKQGEMIQKLVENR